MDIEKVEEEIFRIKKQVGRVHDVFLMPIIESALGVENAYGIASSSRNVVAMVIGLEDYTADLGVLRTCGGRRIIICKNASCECLSSGKNTSNRYCFF